MTAEVIRPARWQRVVARDAEPRPCRPETEHERLVRIVAEVSRKWQPGGCLRHPIRRKLELVT